MADTRTLSVRLTVEDYAVVQRALVQLGEVGERALTRISAASTRAAPAMQQVSQAAAQAEPNMRRSGEAIRQVGYQIQDLVIQIQGGQSPFLALSQQGGQLAQALLGPKAALAATGVLISAMVAKSLLFKDANAEVAESEKKLAEAIEATNKVLLSRQQGEFIDRQKQIAAASQAASEALEKEKQKLAELEDALKRAERANQGRRRGAAGDALPADADRFATSLGFLRTQVEEQRALVAQLGARQTSVMTPSKQFPDAMKAIFGDPEKIKEVIEGLKLERDGLVAVAGATVKGTEAVERATAANKAALEIKKLKIAADSDEAREIRALILGSAELAIQTKRTADLRAAELKIAQQKVAAEEAEIVAMEKAANAAVAAQGKLEVATAEEIDLLKGQAEAARQSTVEFDALTGSYRLATVALDAYNKEQELLKRGYGATDAKRLAQDFAEQKQAIDRINDSQKALIENLNRQTELMQEPFKNAIAGIQGAFADMFEDIFSGSTDLFDSLKRVATRFAAEIATLLVFRPATANLLQSLGYGDLAQQMGLGPYLQGAMGSAVVANPSMLGGTPGQVMGGASGPLGFLGGITSFLGPWGTAAAAIGIPVLGGVLGKLFGGGGRNPDDIARENFTRDLIQRQQGMMAGVNQFIAAGQGGGRSSVGQQLDALSSQFRSVYDPLYQSDNAVSPVTDKLHALEASFWAQHKKIQEDFVQGLKDSVLAIQDAGGEMRRGLDKTAEDLRKSAREAGVGFAEAEALIAAQLGAARGEADRGMALALGQFTGDPSAAWAELQRTQQERLRTVESLGGDRTQAEAALAAERLQYLRGLSAAQRAILGESLGEADRALLDLADAGLTAGEKLLQGADALQVFGEQIDDFLKGLDQSDLSPLGAGAKYAASRSQLEATLAAARGGDAQAIARAQAEAQLFLTNSRGLFASGDQYSQDYAWATGLLSGLGADAPGLATSLGRQGIQANQALLGGLGQQSAAEKAAAQALAAAAQAALAQVTPQQAAQAAAANSNTPSASGPSQGFLDALMNEIYPGLSFASAPADAQGAVRGLFANDPYTYLMAGGDRAAATLINTGLYTATDLYSRFGINGLTGFGAGGMGAASAVQSLLDTWWGPGGSDSGLGTTSPGAAPSGLSPAAAEQALADTRDLFSELASLGMVPSRGLPGLPSNQAVNDQAIASIQSVLADLREKSLSLSDIFADLSIASPAVFSDLMGINIADLKAFADALGAVAGQASVGLGGMPGTDATGNPADAAVGFSDGGWVNGRIRGVDSVRAWLTPSEFVMPVEPARAYAPELEAMRAGTYRGAGNDQATAAEVRALRAELTEMKALLAELVGVQRAGNTEANTNTIRLERALASGRR